MCEPSASTSQTRKSLALRPPPLFDALVPAARDEAARLLEVPDGPDQVSVSLVRRAGHGVVEVPHVGVLVHHGRHQELIHRVDIQALWGRARCKLDVQKTGASAGPYACVS